MRSGPLHARKGQGVRDNDSGNDAFDEDLRESGIVSRSGALKEQCGCILAGAGNVVAALRRHCIKRVCNRDTFRDRMNLFPGNPEGIRGVHDAVRLAIHPLVMLKDAKHHFVREVPPNDDCPVIRVVEEFCVLLRRQIRARVDDGGSLHDQLADVVQLSRDLCTLSQIVAPAQFRNEHLDVIPHPLGVAARVRILPLKHLDENRGVVTGGRLESRLHSSWFVFRHGTSFLLDVE